MMFPSNMGGETPTTLGIRDNDAIMVHRQSDSNKENMTDTSHQKHTVTTNKKSKVAWKKSSRGKVQIKLDKHTMTVEDYTRQHSMILSGGAAQAQRDSNETKQSRHRAPATKIK